LAHLGKIQGEPLNPKKSQTIEELFVSHGSTTAIAFHYMNPTIKFGRSLSRRIYEVKKSAK